jgi:hypothetical protein
MKKTILLIPEKTDIEFEQVFKTWTENGGEIRRLGKYWIKDETLNGQNIAIYGNHTFSLVLAEIYKVELISPEDKDIAKLDQKWVKRNIELKTISDITENIFPIFIKPVVPKLFVASVFSTFKDFEKATFGLEKTEEILTSKIIDDIKAEARGYLKKGIIKDIALYEGNANIKEVELFLQNFAENNLDILPEVVVIDIAYSEKIGWFVLEFNACWGAGLNNCKAEKVIDCIIDATKNLKN